ncbi:MAG: hypothetical protein ACKOSR_06530, partial [Flavobacteriales bacterium]
MKRALFLFIVLILSIQVWSQRLARNKDSGYVVASQFAITPPLTELARQFPVDENAAISKEKEEEEAEDRKKHRPQKFKFSVEDDPIVYGNDEATIQRGPGEKPSDNMKASWGGQTTTVFRPFDPTGAVGPNHYVQMINTTTFRVYDKTTGTVILTQTLGNLWSPATENAGDPIVMYDKPADRWMLAQFGSINNNNIYIAVSTTSDPTGSYYTWTFSSPAFPDYLKFGVWHDGYYMTSNQTDQVQRVFAFERNAMLTGSPTARAVWQGYSPPRGGGFFCPLPGCASDGILPPVGTPCPIYSFSDNAWGTGITDAVQIYNMSVNWASTPTASISLANTVPVAAFDASYSPSLLDCSQPGTTQRLDGIGGCLMYRVQWKAWPTYNSVVMNWAVRISSTQRSIKWCELRQNTTTGVWSLYQEGIYTPDTDTRWMGAICMDNNGGIGLSYIKSNSTTVFPGIYYTGRSACDPLGTMPIAETLVIAGAGSQTG